MSVAVTAFCLALTVGAYALSRVIGGRYPSPFTVPVFLSTPLIMVVLVVTGTGLSGYAQAQSIMTWFLGPATVALAVPLYRNRRVLVDHWRAVSVGLVVGVLSTMVSAIALARLLGLPPELQSALSIKSVTAPVAIALAPAVGASPTLVAAFAILTGLIGSMAGPWLLARARVSEEVARGEALGVISHGQGTAQALTEGELTGASASVAMGSAAVLTALLAPTIVTWLVG